MGLRNGGNYSVTVPDDVDMNTLVANMRLRIESTPDNEEILYADLTNIKSALSAALIAKNNTFSFDAPTDTIYPMHAVSTYSTPGNSNEVGGVRTISNFYGNNSFVVADTAVRMAVTVKVASSLAVLQLGDLEPGYFGGKAVTVTYTAEGGARELSLGQVATIKRAIASLGASSVTSTTSDANIHLVFNGDDLFDTHASIGTGKVFSIYGNNDYVFDGLQVKNSGGSHLFSG